MANTKWESTERIIKRVQGWTKLDYAKFYSLALLSQGYRRAEVRMDERRDTVRLIAYRPVA